jgi:tetratricopeptide (TPR) repeat protein
MRGPAGFFAGRRIVFIGNCQSRSLHELYRRYVAPRTLDRTEYIDARDLINPGSVAAIADADIVVDQAVGPDRPSRLPGLAEHTPRFVVPFVSGSVFWPYADRGHETATGFLAPRFGLDYSDRYLNRAIAQGRPAEEVVQEYMAMDLSRSANLASRFELWIETLTELDAETGFAAAPLVQAYFRREGLFRSLGHPELRILHHLADTLFRQMGADSTSISLLNSRLTATNIPVQPGRAPIHPSVVKHFSLDFVTPDSTYRLWDHDVTFEDFVRRYMTLEWDTETDEALKIAREGEPAAAISALSDAVRRTPLSGQSHAALAELLSRNGQLHDAQAAIAGAIVAEPNAAHHRFVQSRLFAAVNNTEAAAEAAKQCTELDPGDATYYQNLSDILSTREDWAGATEAHRNAASLAPMWPWYHQRLGHLLQNTGNRDDAEASVAEVEAIELGPMYGLLPAE